MSGACGVLRDAGGYGSPPLVGARQLCGERRGQRFRLCEVLMGWAIAIVWQRHPLAWRSLPGAGATLQWIPMRVESIARQIANELVDQS
jgi:hypothetical protein